jgi:hypothetical protein
MFWEVFLFFYLSFFTNYLVQIFLLLIVIVDFILMFAEQTDVTKIVSWLILFLYLFEIIGKLKQIFFGLVNKVATFFCQRS